MLILDEPTNHIDNEMVAWMEKYLQKYTGALLMVTHDRYFLDRVTNRIVEINNGSLYSYTANYSKFLEMKAQREEMEIGTERKRSSFLRHELEWIKRGARARSTKSKDRIDRFEELSSGKVLWHLIALI
jgi:ATP-binding cassette subfamily F protein uup